MRYPGSARRSRRPRECGSRTNDARARGSPGRGRRRLGTDLLVVSFSLVLPAVVIALTRVAWTPLAERYLYLPAVFSSIGIILLLHESSKRFNLQKLLVAVLAILLLPLGWVTTSRAVIWQDNLLLYEDTIRKSPTFLPLYNEYAVALAENGRMSEAEQYLEKGRQMDTQGDVLAVHTNQASLLANEGNIEEALKLVDDFMTVNDGKMSVHQLNGVVKAVEQIKFKVITSGHLDVVNKLLEDDALVDFDTPDGCSISASAFPGLWAVNAIFTSVFTPGRSETFLNSTHLYDLI